MVGITPIYVDFGDGFWHCLNHGEIPGDVLMERPSINAGTRVIFPNHMAKRFGNMDVGGSGEGGISGWNTSWDMQPTFFFVFFHELPAFLDGVVFFSLPHVAERYLIYIPGSSHDVLAQDCAQEFAPGEPAWSRAGTASTRTSDSKAQWIKWLGGLSVCLDINMRYSIVLVGTFFFAL